MRFLNWLLGPSVPTRPDTLLEWLGLFAACVTLGGSCMMLLVAFAGRGGV